jgi:anti-anti-sigma factor
MPTCTSPTTTPRSVGRFSVRASRADETALVALRGELDLAAVAQLDAALRPLLEGGVRDLLVDLERLTYLDCAGLGALVRTGRAAQAVGARVYVFRAQGRPREVIAWARARCAIAEL